MTDAIDIAVWICYSFMASYFQVLCLTSRQVTCTKVMRSVICVRSKVVVSYMQLFNR